MEWRRAYLPAEDYNTAMLKTKKKRNGAELTNLVQIAKYARSKRVGLRRYFVWPPFTNLT